MMDRSGEYMSLDEAIRQIDELDAMQERAVVSVQCREHFRHSGIKRRDKKSPVIMDYGYGNPRYHRRLMPHFQRSIRSEKGSV